MRLCAPVDQRYKAANPDCDTIDYGCLRLLMEHAILTKVIHDAQLEASYALERSPYVAPAIGAVRCFKQI